MAVKRSTIGMVGFWLLVGGLELLVVLAFLPSSLLEKTGRAEYNAIQSFLGEESATRLRSQTDYWYDKLFNQTGIVTESYNILVPTEEQKERSGAMKNMGSSVFAYAEARITAWWTAVYIGLHRIFSLLIWLPGLLPLAVAAGIDGSAMRKVKADSYQRASALFFGTGKSGLAILLLAPLVMALFPFPLPPVIAPLWVLAIIFLLSLVIRNWPKA